MSSSSSAASESVGQESPNHIIPIRDITYPNDGSVPDISPYGYVTVFMSSFLAGFRQQIPRIIDELCAEVEIAPSQLTLRSWGLMNAIQVLSDLSGIFVTGLMVAGAFRVQETAFNSRRFELLPRSGARSPVLIPDWLNPSEEGGHYIYVLHRGPLAISRSWSPPGMYSTNRENFVLG